MSESELKSKVAFTAKMLIKAGIIEGFGHVSLRVKRGFLITSTRPLAKSTSKNVIFYNISDPPKKSPKDMHRIAERYALRVTLYPERS